MIKKNYLAILIFLPTLTLAAQKQEIPPTMQSLLDNGFKISAAADGGGILLQKDNVVYVCHSLYEGKTRRTIDDSTAIRVQYYCYEIH